MAVNQKPPPKGSIAQTPAQKLGEIKGKMIKKAKARYALALGSCLLENDILPNAHLLRTVGDAYERGFADCMELWHNSLKAMDSNLPKR